VKLPEGHRRRVKSRLRCRALTQLALVGRKDLLQVVGSADGGGRTERTECHPVGVYVSDAINLPLDALQRTREVIRRDVDDWSMALREVVAGLDVRQARVRVQAAMAAIHDVVRLGHFASRPGIEHEAAALARAILER
jgi:hypothetical protein